MTDIDSLEFNNLILNQPVKKDKKFFWFIVLAGLIIVFALFLRWLSSPPKDFPTNALVNVEQGLTASEIVSVLKDNKLIRSETWFYIVLLSRFDPKDVKAGTYVFENPLSVYDLGERLTGEAPPSSLTVVTFPEGYSSKEYAILAEKVLGSFDSATFVTLAKPAEGKLFPDTYYVPTDFTAEDLYSLLTKTFFEKTAEFEDLLNKTDLSRDGVITLASIIEREANSDESMQMVANILKTRLDIGMPLQADASLEYILDKPLGELTAEDLDIDSPYNTYLNTGLPPTPIGNPGLSSILAVLNAKDTDYLFYITDGDGNFHYAKTYAEHQQNIKKYLK